MPNRGILFFTTKLMALATTVSDNILGAVTIIAPSRSVIVCTMVIASSPVPGGKSITK